MGSFSCQGNKEKMFEREFGEDTGPGLFLARVIFSLQGICIQENGEDGRGARFEITVPQGRYRVS